MLQEFKEFIDRGNFIDLAVGSVGAVLTALLNFVIIAFVLFLIVRAYNRSKRRNALEPEAQAEPEDVALLREIRDLLRAAEGGSAAAEPPQNDPLTS